MLRRLRGRTAAALPIVAGLLGWSSDRTAFLAALTVGVTLMVALLTVNQLSSVLGPRAARAEIAVDLVAAIVVANLLMGRSDAAGWLVLVLPVLEAAFRLPPRWVTVTWAVASTALVVSEALTADSIHWGNAAVRLLTLALVARLVVRLRRELDLEAVTARAHGSEAERRARILGEVAAAGRRLDSRDPDELLAVVSDLGRRLGADRVGAARLERGSWITTGDLDQRVVHAAGILVAIEGRTRWLRPDDVDSATAAQLGDGVVVAVPVGRDAVVVLADADEPAALVVEAFEIVAEQAGTAIERAVALAEAERLRDELGHRVYHDDLTGLSNRAGLRRSLWSDGRGRRALLFIDLDGFKDVNDHRGHEAGDQLLVVIAQRLSQVIRPDDTVARLGGDEFVLVLDGVGTERAGQVAERVIDAVEAPIDLGHGVRCSVSASVGVAVQRDGEPPDDLLARADAAMYEAKRAGRGRVVQG